MVRQRLVLSAITVTYLAFAFGCQPKEEALSPAAKAMAEHAGHDHGEGDHEGHDHDGHDHSEHADIDIDSLMPIEATPGPKDLSSGVEQLATLRETVGKGFADDDVDSIHDQLHSVGNLLECVEELVKSSDLTGDAKTEANKAIEQLFDAYGDVDSKLHGQEGKDYSEVADDIETAIKTLQDLTTAEKE